MVSLGVTTVECKSGYGLDRDHELQLLQVYRRLGETEPVRIVPTFLGAHVVPAEYRERREAYLALLVDELIPAIGRERLATACDVFLEDSAFTIEEARRILLAGRAVGLAPRLHADQLSSSGGAELAAEVGARSADHLEHVSERGIVAMAEAGVVAVSLPIASLYLNQPPMPARRMLEAGVGVAVATDFNPGTAPSYHLPLAMTLACLDRRPGCGDLALPFSRQRLPTHGLRGPGRLASPGEVRQSGACVKLQQLAE
jgi:imidazolonepropionase